MLKSIAASMGGTVVAASDLIALMRIAGAKKIPRSAKKKLSLTLAPGLTVPVEYALMVAKSTLSTLRQHFVHSDSRTGALKTSDLVRDVSYRDAESPDVEVEHDFRARAYR